MSILISNFLSHHTNHCSWGLSKPLSFQHNTHTTGTQICVNSRSSSQCLICTYCLFCTRIICPEIGSFLLVVWQLPRSCKLKTQEEMLYCILIPFRFQIRHFLFGPRPSALQGIGLRKKIYDLLLERLYFPFLFNSVFVSWWFGISFLNTNTFPLVCKIGFQHYDFSFSGLGCF